METPCRKSWKKQMVGGERTISRVSQATSDTKVWHALNAFAREQADNAQFLTPGQRLLYPHSTLPSTAAPSVVGIQRASPSRVLMDNALRGHRFRPPINILPTQQTAQAPEDIIASATEVATPSNAGTPDLCAFGKTIQDAIAWTQDSQFHRQPSPAALLRSPPRFDQLRSQEGPSNASARKLNGQDGAAESVSMAQIRSILEQLLPYLGQIHDHLKANTNAQDVVRSLSRRLETLETASFSHIPVEEIQEKFELFDGRLLDIEGWKEEQEKRPAAETYTTQEPRHRRRLPSETDSFASNASCGSARSVSRGSAQADQQLAVAVARLDNMKEQLDDLETHASPSFRSPWTVEVIFLPWGRNMKGIWVSADNEPPHQMKPSTQALEEWTQTQVSTSASAPLISNTGTGWTTESIQAWAHIADSWLSPKACGSKGVIYKRLKSRGFVREVQLTKPDARSVSISVASAFDDVSSLLDLDVPVSDQQCQCEPVQERYLGLRERFIPLRKVHRSSRLRFLSPAEMVTSATWTTAFLDSSVFMKAKEGERRLFVTTPHAYIQSEQVGCTWQQLRELSPVFGEEVDDANARHAADKNGLKETCWEHHPSMDPPTSLPTSPVSSFGDGSHWSTKSQQSGPSQHGKLPCQHSQEASMHEHPAAGNEPISPLSQMRPAHRRASSYPASSEGDASNVPIFKRRITSLDHPVQHILDSKRRRISLSPGTERRGANVTPRRSREPPSPFTTSENAQDVRSQGTAAAKRGGTPFAYATPHSNNAMHDFVGFANGVFDGGDTEADTDVAALDSEKGEDEWEGVADEDDGNQDAHAGAQSSGGFYDEASGSDADHDEDGE
ncbi:hypothetical protein LTR66_002028 [Elasticomyces elasticus]|nr:hypothetical protein LTR66_002028 [Elasticomyces elasticus]